MTNKILSYPEIYGNRKMKLKLNKTPETLQDILDNLKYLWEENKRLKKNLRELRKKLKEFGNP